MDRVHFVRLDFDRPRIRGKHQAMQHTLDAAMVSKSIIGCRFSTFEKWLHGLFSFLLYTKLIYTCWTRFFRSQDGSITSVDIRKQFSALPLSNIPHSSYIYTPSMLLPLNLSWSNIVGRIAHMSVTYTSLRSSIVCCPTYTNVRSRANHWLIFALCPCYDITPSPKRGLNTEDMEHTYLEL